MLKNPPKSNRLHSEAVRFHHSLFSRNPIRSKRIGSLTINGDTDSLHKTLLRRKDCQRSRERTRHWWRNIRTEETLQNKRKDHLTGRGWLSWLNLGKRAICSLTPLSLMVWSTCRQRKSTERSRNRRGVGEWVWRKNECSRKGGDLQLSPDLLKVLLLKSPFRPLVIIQTSSPFPIGIYLTNKDLFTTAQDLSKASRGRLTSHSNTQDLCQRRVKN